MTIPEIRELVAEIDPNIRHYFSMGTGTDYTFWEETERLPMMADNHHVEEAWRFYVHRFTKTETDPLSALIFSTLDNDPRVSVRHTVDHEDDTGYIHHIFECEGI